MKKLLLLVLVLLAIFAFISVAAGEEWAGADEQAEEAIKEINPNYEPWFSPVWEPPSGEIESFLFSLQAAVGALLIGYFLGYYRGTKHARNA